MTLGLDIETFTIHTEAPVTPGIVKSEIPLHVVVILSDAEACFQRQAIYTDLFNVVKGTLYTFMFTVYHQMHCGNP